MQINIEENSTLSQSDTKMSLFKRLFGPKAPAISRKPLPFKPIDLLAMLGISLFYALFAFHDLGNTTAPSTTYTIPYNTSIELSSADGTPIDSICWYLLDEQLLNFSLEVKNNSDTEWTYLQDLTMEHDVFGWSTFVLPNPEDTVRITNTSLIPFNGEFVLQDDIGNVQSSLDIDYIPHDATLGEIVLLDSEGNILLSADTNKYPALFDETDTFPKNINHLSGCYFDEIYYTATAYQFMHGLPAYEYTHPPFGKILITLGVSIFGATPFGFRIMGTLLGVLMLPFIYLLGRNITQNRGLGAFVCFLFAFDFMHFVQTRITTIDVFITFFVILMYYFMEQYVHLSFYDASLQKTWLPLGACGIAFGFGIASKWTGFYAGAGLAILFFSHLFIRYREYRYALLTPEGVTNGIAHHYIIHTFKKHSLKTIAFCMVFFVAIPFTIYLLSYLPFVDFPDVNAGLFERMINNQKFMFSFHSTLESTHYYSSKWYEWPTMVRPMLYYAKSTGLIIRQGISAFGNPLVWWAGIPAFIYMLYLSLVKKKKEAAFLCVAYLAQYLPWIFITRYTFIYHYFPSIPFVALMIGYSFLQLKDKALSKKILDEKSFYCLLIIYAAAAFGLFQMFLPVLSGQEITTEYVATYLRWCKDWVLVLP